MLSNNEENSPAEALPVPLPQINIQAAKEREQVTVRSEELNDLLDHVNEKEIKTSAYKKDFFMYLANFILIECK